MKHFTIAMAIAVVAAQAQAAGLGTKIFDEPGGWSVMRSTDSMTDKPSCVAIYKDNANVQASLDYLYVSGRGRGGISSYQYRLDDGPASELKLPNDVEKKTSAVNLVRAGMPGPGSGTVKRVRVKVLTVLSTSFDEDIDLTGFAKVKPVLEGDKCKG